MKCAQTIDDERRIGKYLMMLGIFPDLKGYGLIIKAIQQMQASPIGTPQYKVFAAVCKQNSTKPGTMFNAIDYAIGCASIAKTSAYRELFGRCVLQGRKPTNARFLAMVIEALRLGLDKEKVSA